MEETEILKIELQWSYTLRPVACSNSQATALLMNQHGGGVQHCGYSLFPAPLLGQGCCLYSAFISPACKTFSKTERMFFV